MNDDVAGAWTSESVRDVLIGSNGVNNRVVL